MNMPKEIWELATHHKEILERRFPNYGYEMYEWDHWLRIEVSDRETIFIVAFSLNYLKTATPPFGNVEIMVPLTLIHTNPNFTEEISYADPKFTDNFLIDTLVELGCTRNKHDA